VWRKNEDARRCPYVLVCFGTSEVGAAQGKSVSYGTPAVQVLRNRIHQAHDAAQKSTKEVKHAKTTFSRLVPVFSTLLHHRHCDGELLQSSTCRY